MRLIVLSSPSVKRFDGDFLGWHPFASVGHVASRHDGDAKEHGIDADDVLKLVLEGDSTLFQQSHVGLTITQ